MSGRARADAARDLREHPPPPGVTVVHLPFGVFSDGTKLARKAFASGYPVIAVPFFLKLPYRLNPAALRRLALIPPVFLAKATDSASERAALTELFQSAFWLGVFKEIVDVYGRGGFYVEGIAGAPENMRVLVRPLLLGIGGDSPAIAYLMSLVLGRCPLCIAVRSSPYHAPGGGAAWRTEQAAAAARAAARAAPSAAAAKRALGAVGVHLTPSVLARLLGSVWNDGDARGIYGRVYPDAVLHNLLIGKILWFIVAIAKIFATESLDGSAAAALARLVASNAHFSTGVKRWVSLRNIRFISWFSGFMRASQLVMTVAALRAVSLDLGDAGQLQAALLRIGELLVLEMGLVEAEKWSDANRARLAAVQAEAAAASDATLAPYGVGFASHPNAHPQYHVVEIAGGDGGLGTPVHWDSGRTIETAHSDLKNGFAHYTGVETVEATLARYVDAREFVASNLRPALDCVLAAHKAREAGGGGAGSGEEGDSGGGRDGRASSASGRSSPRGGEGGPAVAPAAPYTRYPFAPPVSARLTGDLWESEAGAGGGAGMRCEGRDGHPRLSARLVQAAHAAYAALAASGDSDLPPDEPWRWLWRRSLMLSRPPALETEGCKRRLTVVPDGVLRPRSKDSAKYAGRQPCVQLLVQRAAAAGPGAAAALALCKVEALVSIDVRRLSVVAARPLTARTTGGDDTIDFALVRTLQHNPAMDSDCFRGYINAGPSLGAGCALAPADLAHFRLVRVTSLCQPRWAFPAFRGDDDLPVGGGDVLPWDGPLVSVLVIPGA